MVYMAFDDYLDPFQFQSYISYISYNVLLSSYQFQVGTCRAYAPQAGS